jgi:dihydropteroate synthase
MTLPPMKFGRGRFDWSRPYLMGVLNVTPDSFSDGGHYQEPEAACARAFDLYARGADVIDIGGESTRPNAAPVTAAEEIERVVPIIRELRAHGFEAPISVDTTKAEVAAAALSAGADMVNDISGGLFDPAMTGVVAAAGAIYVLGHVRGRDIASVHAAETEPPAADEVIDELCERVARLPVALRHRTIVDPCLGFGKGLPENLALIRDSGRLSRATGCPVLIGPSRKRFVRTLLADAESRESDDYGRYGQRRRVSADTDPDAATVGACLAATAAGAHFLRIHDIELLWPAVMVYQAIMDRLS